MTRLQERLVDLAALAMFLVFAYVIIEKASELAGGVVVAAAGVWFSKNAQAPKPPSEVEAAAISAETIAKAAALAAAEVLKVAAVEATRGDTLDPDAPTRSHGQRR